MKIKWFINYQRDKIYQIIYSKKFAYKYFSDINNEEKLIRKQKTIL